jgi:hypothetical protein
MEIGPTVFFSHESHSLMLVEGPLRSVAGTMGKSKPRASVRFSVYFTCHLHSMVFPRSERQSFVLNYNVCKRWLALNSSMIPGTGSGQLRKQSGLSKGLSLYVGDAEGSKSKHYLLCAGRGVARLYLLPTFTLASAVETRCKQIVFRSCLSDLLLRLKLPCYRQNLTHPQRMVRVSYPNSCQRYYSMKNNVGHSWLGLCNHDVYALC